MVEPIRLSVIVTVFSETQALLKTIERVRAVDRGYISEIILTVAPRSSPECFAICEQLTADDPLIRFHVQKRVPGVGWALREAMELSQGTYVALLSADLETEPEAIDRMVRKIEETDCDAVIGNRWLKGGGFQNYDRIKLVLNWFFQRVFRILFWTKLGDLTYGYKILSKNLCDTIVWTGTLHEIYVETTIKPLKAGFHIEQVPTVWIGRDEGVSTNTFWRNFRYIHLALSVWWKGVPRVRPNQHRTQEQSMKTEGLS